MAMKSPLASALVWNKWLKDCPHCLKPVLHRRYAGDIFVIFVSFSSLDQAKKFKRILPSKQPNVNFSLEKENDDLFKASIFIVKKEFFH